MTVSLTERVSSALESVLSRRSFITRSAYVGSAIAAGAGLDLVLKPGTAYGAICGCGNLNCSCGSTCCEGFSEFCCSVNNGQNYCPSNTLIGGWWKADNSSYCGGPRYYMDCNALCACESGCVSGHPFCSPGCDGVNCTCGGDSCDNWLTGCLQFRYGQCNQDIACMGRIVCRVVACVPPWEIDPTCTTTLAVDNATAEHDAPCWTPAPPPEMEDFMAVTASFNNASNVFAVGPDGNLRQRWQPNGTSAWGVELLATGLVPNQTPGLDVHNNELHLYAVRPDNTIMHVYQPTGSGTWYSEIVG